MLIKHTEALCAAIAWAKQNPDKIQAASLSNGESTMDPNATCFCILGIAARMACQDFDQTSQALDYFGLPNEVWLNNDAGVNAGNPLRGANYLGSLIKC